MLIINIYICFLKETQISLLSSFGEDANLIKAGILQKLSRRSEDPRFKVVVTELFTTCVVKQTGLLEMFLSEQKLAAAGVIKSQSAQEISQVFISTCHSMCTIYNS